jgi:hypothetical protein
MEAAAIQDKQEQLVNTSLSINRFFSLPVELLWLIDHRFAVTSETKNRHVSAD